jgi:arylsulfatase A-like enzyme
VFQRLEKNGLLDNTYILYSADNGYHIGQHRLQPGKECGYEEDVNIPFIIRGPGIAKNVTSDLVTTHTDLAPTILNLIGEKPRPDFDGLAIPVTQQEISAASDSWHEHVTIEYWGFAVGEGKYDSELDLNRFRLCQSDHAPDEMHVNNTYKAIRVIGKDYNLYYSVWCHGEHELYNLKVRHTVKK